MNSERLYRPLEPMIQRSEAITSSECPYRVDIDSKGFATVLELAGVSAERIGRTTLTLDRRFKLPAFSKYLLGNYRPSENKVVLYLDPFWNRQKKRIDKARRLAGQGRLFVDNDFRGMPSGRRLTWYLSVAPRERALATAQKLINSAASRELNATLLHESHHAGEMAEEVPIGTKIRTVGGAIAGGLAGFAVIKAIESPNMDPLINLAFTVCETGVSSLLGMQANYWLIEPEEKKARSFAKEFKNNPEYRFISITPKKPLL